jgi:hypothetical protein
MVVRDGKLGFKRKESMDTNSQVERKKQKIAGLGAQKKYCAFLRKILAFLRKILAFLRVLARCFRVVKPEIV